MGGFISEPGTAQAVIIDNDATQREFHIKDRILETGPNRTAVENIPWLSLSAYSGTGPSDVTATVNVVTPLPPGLYHETITITGDTGNSPQTVHVYLTVE